jgi:hypothetical protein
VCTLTTVNAWRDMSDTRSMRDMSDYLKNVAVAAEWAALVAKKAKTLLFFVIEFLCNMPHKGT